MEYGGTWWTSIVHDNNRTKPYDINQHQFIAEMGSDTEVYEYSMTLYVDATTEDGMDFCFQYTKKTDPVYALEPTKKWAEGRTGTTWVQCPVHTKDRLDFPICPARVEGQGLGRSIQDPRKVHKLVPMGRVIEQLGLTLLWTKHGGELRCSDGKKTHLLMQFSTKGTMQYATENQFELLRKALWTSAIKSVPNYDAEFR
eukprot:3373341-Amphidinium_carterae.5